MIVYQVMPIDFWAGWRKPSELFGVSDHNHDDGQFHDPAEWPNLWKQAQKLATEAGWEGDIREGPYVTVVPDGESGGLSPVIIAWKQDNNGTTFVASPFPLPWVSKEAFAVAVS